MGLLDDAIREHLELKRRRGADPGEVAREQREALEPVPRDQRSEGGGVAVAEDLTAEPVLAGDADAAPPGADSPPFGDEPLGDDSDLALTGAAVGDPSAVVQETAELDMQTVLDGREDEPEAAAGADADVESLEWEVPGEAVVEPSADVGHKARAAAGDVDESDSGEDVLEETPEFLRDTPEQDRLWFEQRPPRDFDFDK